MRGRAAAERILRMLCVRYNDRLLALWCQPSPRVGLRWPSLGELAPIGGGFRELARVGIGNGGRPGSARLGLLERPRPWWLAIPLWIMAFLRIAPLRLSEDGGGGAGAFSCVLPGLTACLA